MRNYQLFNVTLTNSIVFLIVYEIASMSVPYAKQFKKYHSQGTPRSPLQAALLHAFEATFLFNLFEIGRNSSANTPIRPQT